MILHFYYNSILGLFENTMAFDVNYIEFLSFKCFFFIIILGKHCRLFGALNASKTPAEPNPVNQSLFS